MKDKRLISIRVYNETYSKLKDIKIRYMKETKRGVNMSSVIRAILNLGLKSSLDEIIEEVDKEREY